MKLSLSDFSAVSFHDSRVQQIEESSQRIRLSLDFAIIRPPLQDAAGKCWKLVDCSLECLRIQRSEKEEWSDTVKARPHSTPGRPIEEVQHEETTDDCLALSGLTQNNNWGVWRIAAEEFHLTWREKNEIQKG